MGHPKDRELVREAVQCEAIHHTKLGKFPPPPPQLSLDIFASVNGPSIIHVP